MASHLAVAAVGIKTPLELVEVATIEPVGEPVRFRVEWTVSTPLDLHQNDSGLLIKHPSILGSGAAGTVVQVGFDAKRLKIGDKLRQGFTLAEVVTLPNNFVTLFHAFTADLGLETPWPKANGYVPKHADSPILIWGGSSSVGQFAIQVLRYYGCSNILVTASRKNYDQLRGLGATELFDYNDPGVVALMTRSRSASGISFILDCIGSKFASIAPISQIAKRGTKVAILLPVIIRDSSETGLPIHEMEVQAVADWKEGVDARGVRTHFYLNNETSKYYLQPDIMPTLLSEGIVTPQRQKTAEGATLLERAQNAMNMLSRKEAI